MIQIPAATQSIRGRLFDFNEQYQARPDSLPVIPSDLAEERWYRFTFFQKHAPVEFDDLLLLRVTLILNRGWGRYVLERT